MEISRGKSLFPSASAVKEEGKSGLGKRDPDWLNNQSFPRVSAQALVQHQHGREELFQSQNITSFLPDPQEEAAVIGEQNNRRENTPSSHTVGEQSDGDPVHAFKHSMHPLPSKGNGSDFSPDEKKLLDEEYMSSSVSTKKSEYKESNVSCDGATSFLKDEPKEAVGKRSDEGSDMRRSEKRRSDHSRHSKKKKKRHHRDSESSSDSEGRRHKKKKSRHKRRRHRHAEECDKLRKRPPSMWIDDIGSVPAIPFYLDEKSDKNNLCFNSLNFTDVAFYRRLGKFCMGLDPAKQSVDWGDGKSSKDSKKSVKDTGRYFVKSFSEADVERIPVAEKKCHKARGKKEQADYVEMPYIPLPPPLQSSGTSKSLEPDGQQQLDRQNKSGLISSDASQKITFFNKYLHEHPNDITRWLEFVHFQDQAGVDVHAGTPGNEGLTVGSSRRQQLILEKKLAILEKALKANPGNPDLQLEQLELCRENWDSAQLAKHWQSTIRQHRENLETWQQYLAYQRSCFTKFSVSGISKVYEDFLSTLSARGTEFKFDIVLQVCHFWRQAGHSEKAVALLQAMVEFNCFRPQNIEDSTTLEGKIAFFEPFWDSNEARFGEVGAEGWCKWVHRKEKGGWASQNTQKAQRVEEDESAVEGTEPIWHAWLQEEILREHAHFSPWLPGEGQTDDDCEDPDRMVLFDDISCFLCDLDTQEQKFALILAFLDFLGAYRHHSMSYSEIAMNTLEHPWEVFECGQNMRRNNGTCGVLLNGKLILPLQKTSCQQKVLEDCRHVFQFADTIIDQAIPLFPEEAQCHLRLIQMQYNLKSVEPTASVKKRKKQVKEGQKLAKSILGQESNRSNLRLWEEFARWEWSNGSETEAQRIFETALTFSDTNLSPDGCSLDVCRLLSVYVTLKMGLQASHQQPSMNETDNTSQLARKKQEVLHHLTTLGEGGKFTTLSEKNVSAARILKARKGYVDLCTRLVESYKNSMQKEEMHGCRDAETFRCLDHQGSIFVHFSLCYALFQYLSVSMQACGVIFEETLTTFDSLLSQVRDSVDDGDRTVVQRQLELDMDLMWTFYVRVASHHVNSHPMPVALLRNILQRALKRNSNNPELLDTLIMLEEWSHIAGRLRRYFDRATSETTHPVPWLFAIQAELRRLQKIQGDQDITGRETGITHRVRSLFDKATSSRHTRHCVLLWRLYLHFEVQQGDKQRGKSIFYRAVQHCPWSKSLYMDAVRNFPEELQAILDLLLEKEIRLRAPLEEVELLMRMAQSKLKKE
ncbi:nuclear exosome regulator NRDE2-like [Diadema antillarum]|uniref:nuclear exosome regulator NRDE2-like n=1 Tax=Diadema antillarum TaxID=105358 RepID=UPI003A83DD8A